MCRIAAARRLVVQEKEGVMNRQIRIRTNRRPTAPRDTKVDRRTPSGRLLPY
jgi:hypothetical protein